MEDEGDERQMRGGMSEAEDRRVKGPRDGGRVEVVERGKWRMDGWMETEEGERQTPSTGCQTKSRTNER